MAFKHACFISYCHGQHDLIKGFIDQLKSALKAELKRFSTRASTSTKNDSSLVQARGESGARHLRERLHDRRGTRRAT